MRKSILYSNAVLASRQSKILNSDRIKRMINAQTAEDAAKILFECGYNPETIMVYSEQYNLAVSPEYRNEISVIINSELEATIKNLKELCPDENLLKCILIKYDYNNAKTFYKAAVVPVDLGETIYNFGSIDTAKLKESILNKKYSGLPSAMQQALQNLDKKPVLQAKDIDLELEKAMRTEIAETAKKIKNKIIEKYFQTEADFINIKTCARCRLNQLSYNSDLLFIAGGTLTKQELNLIYSESFEKIKATFNKTEYKHLVLILGECLKIGDLSVLEDYTNNYLIKISEANSQNSYDINLFFNWFVVKLEELKIVKLILTAKKFNFSKNQIRDSLKGVYEKFR